MEWSGVVRADMSNSTVIVDVVHVQLLQMNDSLLSVKTAFDVVNNNGLVRTPLDAVSHIFGTACACGGCVV